MYLFSQNKQTPLKYVLNLLKCKERKKPAYGRPLNLSKCGDNIIDITKKKLVRPLNTHHLPLTTDHLPLTSFHLPLTTLDHPSSIIEHLIFCPSIEKDWMTLTPPNPRNAGDGTNKLTYIRTT